MTITGTDDLFSPPSILDRIDGLPDEGDDGADPAYATLADWVYCYLRYTVEFRPKDVGAMEQRLPTRWCAKWWRHQEVTSRLTALWHTWEQHRQEPAAMAVWWRDFFDPLWYRITGPDGPLANCTPTTCGGVFPPLRVEEPPEDWDPPA